MSRGGAALASLLVTIGRPAWWLLALTGFLVRGGFIVFLLPIVVLPSPLAMSNLLSPLIVPVALGRIGVEVLVVAATAIVACSAWLLVGGWIGAATDLALIREGAAAAADEGVGPDAPLGRSSARRDRVLIRRMAMARLAAWLPLGLAMEVGIARVVAITYVELTRPGDVAAPLVLRVAVAAAPELTAIAVAWLLGELVGGLAVRRIVLLGAPPARAVLDAVLAVARRPASTLLPWLVSTAALAVILGAAVAAASVAWSRVIVALSSRPVDPPAVALNLLLFVAIWLAALDLTGLCAAARGSIQTFEELRGRPATGTFGASAHHRPGDWSIPDEGGSL